MAETIGIVVMILVFIGLCIIGTIIQKSHHH